MKLGTLFSGIDGFSLAGDWIGWKTVFTCEIDKFCNIILNHYNPTIKHYGDIKATDFSIWRGRVDVLAGGFPCQPYSVAGKRKGKDDDRHLWPEMLRAIREIYPRWVVGENVRGIISWNKGLVFDEVQSDLEALGYEVTPYILPACAVNAPHRRDRTFFIAYRPDTRFEGLQRERENGVYRLETTPHTNSDDAGRCGFGKVGCETRDGKSEQEERERLRSEFERTCKKRIIADTKSEQSKPGKSKQSENRRQKQRELRGSNIENDSGNVTNPDSRRQPGKEHRKKKSGFFTEKSIPTDWQDFPTQSPVCNGNDGFSTELLRQRIRDDSMGLLSEKEIDKIISKAVTKVRAESIKAGGNAVVPPLIYQIFKAIEAYENN